MGRTSSKGNWQEDLQHRYDRNSGQTVKIIDNIRVRHLASAAITSGTAISIAAMWIAGPAITRMLSAATAATCAVAVLTLLIHKRTATLSAVLNRWGRKWITS
jgi:CBS domain containing-hemolysin-like protein